MTLEQVFKYHRGVKPELASAGACEAQYIDRDRVEAARDFWYEILKGIDENLREFF